MSHFNTVSLVSRAVIAQVDGSEVGTSSQSTAQPAKGEQGAPGAQPALGGGWNGLMMIALMFGVFYLLLIRPQQKKAKQHQKLLESLGNGDTVVTNGGLVGKVVNAQPQMLTLEVADKTRVRVLRSQVAGRLADFVQDNGKQSNKTEK